MPRMPIWTSPTSSWPRSKPTGIGARYPKSIIVKPGRSGRTRRLFGQASPWATSSGSDGELLDVRRHLVGGRAAAGRGAAPNGLRDQRVVPDALVAQHREHLVGEAGRRRRSARRRRGRRRCARARTPGVPANCRAGRQQRNPVRRPTITSAVGTTSSQTAYDDSSISRTAKARGTREAGRQVVGEVGAVDRALGPPRDGRPGRTRASPRAPERRRATGSTRARASRRTSTARCSPSTTASPATR